MYSAHLDSLTVPVYSPLHKRVWMITPRQFRVVCKINGTRSVTQRGLANETGYSLHGLHRAVESLVSGGIISKLSARGRNGWTRLAQRLGAHAMQAHERNVPEQGSRVGIGIDLGALLGNISLGGGKWVSPNGSRSGADS